MGKWLIKQGKLAGTVILTLFAVISSVVITGLLVVIILPAIDIYLDVNVSIIISALIPTLSAPIVMYPIINLIITNKKYVVKIKNLSEIDEMTNTYRRNSGLDKLENLIFTDSGRRFIVSICYVDINDLKKVNDLYGHKYGDELILDVVKGIKLSIREDDYIIRMGGDEFLIVFNGIRAYEVEIIWKRIVGHLNEMNSMQSRCYSISVSHGVAEMDNDHLQILDEFINEADKMMYQEKTQMKGSTLNSLSSLDAIVKLEKE